MLEIQSTTAHLFPLTTHDSEGAAILAKREPQSPEWQRNDLCVSSPSGLCLHLALKRPGHPPLFWKSSLSTTHGDVFQSEIVGSLISHSLGEHFTEHKTSEYVRQRIDNLAGKQEPMLSVVKRRKLARFGHVNRHDSLAKTILQGTVEGGRRRGRQRKA
ncbi:hypothetical protein ACOMHN_008637 [Nucella lapillus]